MDTKCKKSVGVAVITHSSKKHLPQCLLPLLKSPLKPRVLVVNSSSNDGTVELARDLGADTLVIPRDEFNHGKTRECARKHLGTSIAVMVTPDAYARDEHVLEKLIEPILSGKASIAYARQIAHKGADFLEAFHRAFNYPEKSHIRSIEDLSKWGPFTFFCSDSFAAYSNSALDEIGGFKEALMGEDTVATAKLLQKGHKIAYVAEAVVRHSHRYTLKQEFQRHFDTGLARRKNALLLLQGGGDNKRGREYTKRLMVELWKEKPQLLPYAFLQTATKWLGYKIGCISENAPLWIKKACSSQDYYWIKES